MTRPKGSKNKSKKKIDPVFIAPKNELNELEKTEIIENVIKLPIYKAILKVMGRIYKAEGDTFEEVIGNLKAGNWMKTASVLTIEKDGVKKEKILSAAHTRALFGTGSPTVKQMHVKWVKQIYA